MLNVILSLTVGLLLIISHPVNATEYDMDMDLDHSNENFNTYLNEDIGIIIANFLDFKDVVKLSEVNKKFFKLLSSEGKGGGLCRQQSAFAVTTSSQGVEKKLYLKELLNSKKIGKDHKIISIKGIETMAESNPSYFKRLAIKALKLIQLNSEMTDSSAQLNELYDLFKIDDQLKSLPYEAVNSDRLTRITMEVFILDVIWFLVEEKIRNSFREGLYNRLENEFNDETRHEFISLVRNIVGDDITIAINDKVEQQMQTLLTDKETSEFLNRAIDQITEKIYTLIRANESSDFNLDSLGDDFYSSVTDQIVMLYQIGSFAMRHTEEFNKIYGELAELIFNKDQQDMTWIDTGLENIRNNIPSPNKYKFKNIQFNLMKKYLISF